MKIIGAYQNTNANNEDFALTPYLSLVESRRIYGLGFTWGYYSVCLCIAFGYPKEFKRFMNLTKKED